jgi:acetyl esterase/lipase
MLLIKGKVFFMLNLIKLRVFTLGCLILLGCRFAVANEMVVFPTAKANTPYSEVAKLSSIKADKKWMYGGESDQQYSLFWQAKGNPKGLVVLMHGGCWLDMFDIQHSFPLSTGLAQSGFHVWSIEYRRTGSGGEWPVAFEDVKAGLANIVKLEDIGVDTSIINLVGHSAGGHLALLAASDAASVLPPDTLINTIGLAAIVDIASYSKGLNSCQSATTSFMKGTLEDKPIEYYFANPLSIRFAQTSTNKAVLLHGTKDAIVPLKQGQHPQIEQIVIDGAGHFDWIHPGTEAFKVLTANLKTYE